MPTFKLPLSGDVVQAFTPWTTFMTPIGNQWGFFNVTVGQSSEPAVEADVLAEVGSYGKQLGRIEDALIVLLAHFHPAAPLTKEEAAAIDDLKDMLQRIADVKEKHKRQALRPSVHHVPPPHQPMPVAVPAPPPVPAANGTEPVPAPPSRRPPRKSPRHPA